MNDPRPTQPDLSPADLKDADLEDADLEHADLERADLEHTRAAVLMPTLPAGLSTKAEATEPLTPSQELRAADAREANVLSARAQADAAALLTALEPCAGLAHSLIAQGRLHGLGLELQGEQLLLVLSDGNRARGCALSRAQLSAAETLLRTHTDDAARPLNLTDLGPEWRPAQLRVRLGAQPLAQLDLVTPLCRAGQRHDEQVFLTGRGEAAPRRETPAESRTHLLSVGAAGLLSTLACGAAAHWLVATGVVWPLGASDFSVWVGTAQYTGIIGGLPISLALAGTAGAFARLRPSLTLSRSRFSAAGDLVGWTEAWTARASSAQARSRVGELPAELGAVRLSNWTPTARQLREQAAQGRELGR